MYFLDALDGESSVIGMWLSISVLLFRPLLAILNCAYMYHLC